jgi:hypothetical protein
MITLKGKEISNYTGLKYQIMQLNARKEELEKEINRNFNEIYYSIHPAFILQNTFAEISENRKTQNDIVKIGLISLSDYTIGKLFKRSSSFKRYMLSVSFESLIKYTINRYPNFISLSVYKLKQIIKGKKHLTAIKG